jgi:hypothetical protein
MGAIALTTPDSRHKSMPGAKLRRRARSNPAPTHIGLDLLGVKNIWARKFLGVRCRYCDGPAIVRGHDQ